MPFIQSRLSIKLDENQKTLLQKKLSDIVARGFSKPESYIMSEISDNCDLYMGGQKIEKGGYISIRLLGSASKPACQKITQAICQTLQNEYQLDSSKVYVTYHPVELWGWNGMMF